MNQPTNRYLARIATVTGEGNPVCAAELFVRRFHEAGSSLHETARSLGVERIVEEALPFDGGIFRHDNRTAVIKLNSLAPRTRRRFTLAHEIAHLMLAHTMRIDSSCSTNANLEAACDFLAAEILMPAQQVRALTRETLRSSPDNLRQLAFRFDVSLRAAAVRVHKDLAVWKRQIGLWEWESGGVKEVWFVGRRPWSTRRPTFVAFESAYCSACTVRAVDSFRRGENLEKGVSLELLNIGFNRILGLVDAAA